MQKINKIEKPIREEKIKVQKRNTNMDQINAPHENETKIYKLLRHRSRRKEKI